MSNHEKYQIFLSHASEDRELARALQSVLERALESRKSEQLVFCSSDVRAGEGGADWHAEIIDALRSSSLCLVLLTPQSLHKPWVMYESAGAYAVLQRRPASSAVIFVLAEGVSEALIPKPFEHLRARDLAKYKDAAALLVDIANHLHRSVAPSANTLRSLVLRASGGGRCWDTVRPILVAESSDSSPFNVASLEPCEARSISNSPIH